MLALVRWPNAAISAGAVLVGAWFAAGRVPGIAWPTAAAAALLAGFANADNDTLDATLDVRAHPDRPLPSGALTPRQAWQVAGCCAILGVGCSVMVSPLLGLASTVVVIAMAFYNRVGVRHAALKNGIVAVLASLPFAYGAFVAGNLAAGLALTAAGVPLHFARELAKDLDDAAADIATRRTLPIVAGERVSVIVVWIAVALFAVATLLLARGPRVALLAPAVVVAALAARRAARRERGAPTLFKAAMLAAMAGAVTLRAV